MNLGTYGIFRRAAETTVELARDIEAMGWGTLWLGGSPPGDLDFIEEVTAGTETMTVATGIVNVWRDGARTVAASYHRIEARYPGRFLLGVGIGHPESVTDYQSPYQTLASYLDVLAGAGVPRERMIVAALGPRSLRLAAERTLGSHPYFTTPLHTGYARDIVGPGVVLAPEQTVVVQANEERSKELARNFAARYLRLTNYRNSLLREGWPEHDLADGGSDRLVDEVVRTGDAAEVAEGVRAHLEAGADHVCTQVLGDDPLSGYRALAAELLG